MDNHNLPSPRAQEGKRVITLVHHRQGKLEVLPHHKYLRMCQTSLVEEGLVVRIRLKTGMTIEVQAQYDLMRKHQMANGKIGQ